MVAPAARPLAAVRVAGDLRRASGRSSFQARGQTVRERVNGRYCLYKVYLPPKKDIYQRYLRKFTKGGKLLEAELGLA